MWLQAKKTFGWDGLLPQFQRVQIEFPRQQVIDIQASVYQAIASLSISPDELIGKRIAITAGSRGISKIVEILAALVDYLRQQGAQPFIIPAMGSHGGATAEGQLMTLANLGMTESSLGAPILSDLETVEVGRLSNGMPVYIDRFAAEADAIVIANRIKPHTDYVGDFESGLAKMTVLGMGKLRGADILHRYGVEGLKTLMPEAARLICEKKPILFGLASVENAYHDVAMISAVPSCGIAGEQEKVLLHLAYQLMPRFPFAEIDVLIVEEMGKNISGVGMDPKVVGRVKVYGVNELAECSIRTIAVLRLTPETHGNASGIGLADVTTQQLLQEIDFEATYLNCLTSGITGIQRAMLPMVAPSDRAAIETAFRVCGQPDTRRARAVRIKNTLSLGEIDVSIDLLRDALPDRRIVKIGEAFHLEFDRNGNLTSLDLACYESPTAVCAERSY
jgi:hypothetical protein